MASLYFFTRKDDGRMARTLRAARWGLVAALGLAVSNATAQTTIQGCTLGTGTTPVWSCQDRGYALTQIQTRQGEFDATAICQSARGQNWTGQLWISDSAAPTATSGNVSVRLNCIRTTDGAVQQQSLSGREPTQASFTASCATRPNGYFAAIDDSGVVCHRGCRYVWNLSSEFTNEYIPDGATCSGSDSPMQSPLSPPPPPPPTDPPPTDPPPTDPPPTDPPPTDPPPTDPPPPQQPDLSGLERRLDAIQSAMNEVSQAVRQGTTTVTQAIQQQGTQQGNQQGQGTQAIVDAIHRSGRCVGRGPGDGVVDECDNMAQPLPPANLVTGGQDCSAPPVCTGDAVQCSILRNTWAMRCEGVVDADQVNDLLDQLTQEVPDDGYTPEVWADGDGTGLLGMLDADGMGWSRSCPQLPSVSIMGHTISADPTGDACEFLQLLANLILLAGFAHAGYIVASRGRA